MELLQVIFAGGFATAVIKILFDFLTTRRTKTDALVNAQMISMQDRIAHLGRTYLHDKEVYFEDRRRLKRMHDAYKILGGNGDLDELMTDVYELPLKEV